MAVTLGFNEIKRNSYINSSYTPPSYPHAHEFYEISFCVRSKCTNIINGEKILFQRGVCVILRPKDVHSLEGILPQSNYEHIDLYAPIDRFEKICNACDKSLLEKINESDSPIYFELSADIYAFLFNQSLTLKEMMNNKDESFPVIYSSMIFTILGEWIKTKALTKAYRPNWLIKLLPQFNNVYFLSNNITQIAKETHFSLPYFSKQFKKYMGVSAITYLNKKRIAISKDLLINNPDLRIIDISGMLGFDNPSTYCKHFLHEYNITPSEYRKKAHSTGIY